jgi:hypothetical protein
MGNYTISLLSLSKLIEVIYSEKESYFCPDNSSFQW